MEYRHNASNTRFKDWKLMCDPFLNARHAQKVYRCDGPTSGKSPERPRDPRDSRMNSWTSRREPADLPLPNFRYDEYYVGDPIEKEVTFDNLNDNITRQNLLDMCKPFGVPEDAKVYFHPRTKKHMGIGKVVFRSSRAASECAQKLNNTSKMGNIMTVKVDTMGRERHALIQERVQGTRRPQDHAPPQHPNQHLPHGPPPHAHFTPHPPLPTQHPHDFAVHRQHLGFPPPPPQAEPPPPPPPPFDEAPPPPIREDPRLRLSSHHRPPPARSHWPPGQTSPANGAESGPPGRHSRSRHRRGRRPSHEAASPVGESPAALPNANHVDVADAVSAVVALAARGGPNGTASDGLVGEFGFMSDRRDSSLSNESGATAASVSLQESSSGLAGGAGAQGVGDEESLESRIQNLLKGTSLSSGGGLGGITPSPSVNASMFAAFGAGVAATPMSDDGMATDEENSAASALPGSQQPNTPPSPPSPSQIPPLPLPALPLTSTPQTGRTLLPRPGVQPPPPQQMQTLLANRRTLLPTPPVVGGIALLPTPETLAQLPPPPTPVGQSGFLAAPLAAPGPSPWPEACSDAVLSDILQCLVDELKEVMKRDVSKRMIESCGFPAFHRWWSNQERRVSGGIYQPSVSPSKRSSLPEPGLTSSPGLFKSSIPSFGAGSNTPTQVSAQPINQAPVAGPSAPPPPTDSEGFSSGFMTDAGESAGSQSQPSSAFAALFESLKEGGGGFFSGIRSALPKIKRKPRPATPPREKSNEKTDLGKHGELKDGDKSKGSEKTNEHGVESQHRKRSSSASSGISSDDEASVSPQRRRKQRGENADMDDSDSGTSPAVASDDEEDSESSGGSSDSGDEEEEEEDDDDEDEDEEEEEEEEKLKRTRSLSSSDLSESETAKQRVMLEKQQARLIRQLDKLEKRPSPEKNRARQQKKLESPKKPPGSKPTAGGKKGREEAISSLSSSSSSADEAVEDAVVVKNKASKKPVEKKRDSSLFDVFNSLLEGKQKTSTTLATPQTLNHRRLAEASEERSDREEVEEEMEEAEEKMDDEDGEEEVMKKPVREKKPPPPRKKKQQQQQQPASRRGKPHSQKALAEASEDSFSSSSDSDEEEMDTDEEMSMSGSASSGDEESNMGVDSDVPEPSPSRGRRKQDLFSPLTKASPTKSASPLKPGASPAEPDAQPRARSASQRLKQMKRGEALSPLAPVDGGESSAGDDDRDEAEEELDWLPEPGLVYDWPWEIQHDHSYCFEPNPDAMAAQPLSKPGADLLQLQERRSLKRKRATSSRRGGPGAKKQRSMQDITNRHRDRTMRGSRELASLFTPVEVKSLERIRQREEAQYDDRRHHRAQAKPAKRQQRRIYPQRDPVAEQSLLYHLFVHGIDAEDVSYLKMCYQKLLDQDNTGCSWLNDTHWVDHPVTYISPDSPSRKTGRNRAKPPLSPDIPVHSTGSARTEGFYKLNRTQKFSALAAARNCSVEMLGPRGGDFPTNVNAGNATTGASVTEEVASKKSKLREMRSEQRRLLAEFQDVETGDLLKFNQLKFRKKQLQFGRSGIHSWGLFALETIAAEEMVIEYVGQMVRKHVAEVREKKYEANGIGSSYLFRVDDEYVIDATMCGNFARFINHSCNPNCYAKVVTVEGAKKMVIYSRREILKFEEITYDYKFPYEEEKIPCLCGSAMCRGTLN